ncbi:hypothetical protein TNCV_2834371 [Trichonephila clavipes]|nr:hypothetical protein TNCV_2834371 [Trichonephila clavipes]
MDEKHPRQPSTSDDNVKSKVNTVTSSTVENRFSILSGIHKHVSFRMRVLGLSKGGHPKLFWQSIGRSRSTSCTSQEPTCFYSSAVRMGKKHPDG